jgi:hypothetical protein
MGVMPAADFRPARLRANRILREKRMVVDQVAQNFFGPYGFGAIQRNAIIFGGLQLLQTIQMIRQRDRGGILAEMIIPGSARIGIARQHIGVGMQHGGISVGLKL